jgi:hypothetical protein
MKQLQFSIFFLFGIITNVFSQTSIPISSDGLWIEGSGAWDFFGNFNYNTPNGLAISDTVNINDTLYLQFSEFAYCTGGQTYFDAFLLREDSGKYFYKQNATDAERLWFDFTLAVGETIYLDNCYLIGQVQEQLTVVSIEPTTLGDGSVRQKWTLQYSNSQSGFYTMTEEWIEGIGNVQQGWRHPTAQTCLDVGQWMRCYFENDAWVQTFVVLTPGTDCCTAVSVEEEEATSIQFYPSPATDIINLQFGNGPLPSDIQIFSSTGQLVHKATINGRRQLQINTANFASGVYTVVGEIDGVTMTGKFVKI